MSQTHFIAELEVLFEIDRKFKQECSIQMESKGESESNILSKYDELERNASQPSPQLGLIKATVLKKSNQRRTAVAHCSKTDHGTVSPPQGGCRFYFIFLFN